ncbi:hypothetical protein L484_009494 [Morus notabilis]|uniref:Uncharacterized protein n=1 Tax=Morus notabilis TaxID=981085 RepID=W9QZS1_9ROSA|nr:hypothetical protein L484_009494 [Morus notabilis]
MNQRNITQIISPLERNRSNPYPNNGEDLLQRVEQNRETTTKNKTTTNKTQRARGETTAIITSTEHTNNTENQPGTLPPPRSTTPGSLNANPPEATTIQLRPLAYRRAITAPLWPFPRQDQNHRRPRLPGGTNANSSSVGPLNASASRATSKTRQPAADPRRQTLTHHDPTRSRPRGDPGHPRPLRMAEPNSSSAPRPDQRRKHALSLLYTRTPIRAQLPSPVDDERRPTDRRRAGPSPLFLKPFFSFVLSLYGGG